MKVIIAQNETLSSHKQEISLLKKLYFPYNKYATLPVNQK